MTRLDARGMRCPWPAIRLARALRDGNEAIEIAADDPAAGRELAAVATAAGRNFAIIGPERYRIGSGSDINVLFTDGE